VKLLLSYCIVVCQVIVVCEVTTVMFVPARQRTALESPAFAVYLVDVGKSLMTSVGVGDSHNLSGWKRSTCSPKTFILVTSVGGFSLLDWFMNKSLHHIIDF
jgi:hypothetical protein